MVKPNYSILEFDHMVVFTKDRTIFAAARDSNSTHLRIFLIHESSGNVYTRNGRADSWEELSEGDRDTIISRLLAARNHNQLPIFRVNSTMPQ